MRIMILTALFVSVACGFQSLAQDQQSGESSPTDEVPAVLNFTMKSLDGDDVALSSFQGKVVLIVNVASKCGLTPQYEGLQQLHDEYAVQGLVVLGFPCDQFRNQEFGTEAEIKQFCSEKYGVEFPMFAKVNVNGDDRCKLYKHLTQLDTRPVGKGDISWNFEKFLIGRDGNVIARYSPRMQPLDESILEAIKAELDKPSVE